jgi:hypothetical protein
MFRSGKFLKDTFELDILSDLSQGTTTSNSHIIVFFWRNVDDLSCMNYASYFSYQTHLEQNQAQLTDVTTN